MIAEAPVKRRAVGVDLTVGTFQEHIAAFAELAQKRRSTYVCCVNAHMCVEAHWAADFAAIVNGAAFATADGMPLLRALNARHRLKQERVAGNDIMPALLAEAERQGLSVFLLGSTPEVLERIRARAGRELPRLRWAGMEAPPFKPFDAADAAATARQIEATGAHIVMVSLGCPKQERWMAAAHGHLNAVMLGLGGAFLLYAGVDTRAPKWMRDLSLEWLYRLALEPGRLWKRYLITNSWFLWLTLRDRWGGGL